MSEMVTVKVETNSSYDVIVGNNLIDDCAKMITSALKAQKAMIISDSNVAPLYLERVKTSLEKEGILCEEFVFKAGEESKNLETLGDILEHLAECNFTRSDIVVALGGGVVGDISGFASAIFLRGIRFVQLPTTLLSMVDSSVGGKTAVDLKSGKNLAGAFHQPSLVIADVDTLKTLPEVEIKNGISESIKYGILYDKELFENFEKMYESDLTSLIARCIAHKARVVKNDELDLGERMFLNLGHTVGHAIEKASNYKIPHGLAVSIGIATVAKASAKNGFCEKEAYKKIISKLKVLGLPTECEFDIASLVEIMLSDKKRSGQNINLILVKNIGECTAHKISVEKLNEFFAV